MPLIPEAAAIKETLKHADALSGAVAEEMKLMQQPTAEELAPLMCAYIGFKYLLPGAVGAEELWEDVGKRSLEYVRKNGNSVAGMDVLPHCGSASSATHKKILLQLSLQKDLGIRIPPKRGAKCETVGQLAALTAELLAEKR